LGIGILSDLAISLRKMMKQTTKKALKPDGEFGLRHDHPDNSK